MPPLDSSIEDVPELAPRHRIDAGRGLVEQQDARLRDQGAGERELLLHPSAEPSREPIAEAGHPEHGEVAAAARVDLLSTQAPQLPDVAKVLGDGEILVEAPRLREIAGQLARVARRPAQQ